MHSLKIFFKGFRYLKPFRFAITVVILLVFIQNVLVNFCGFFLGKAVDAATTSDFNKVILFLILYAVLTEILPMFLIRIRFLYEAYKTDQGIGDYIKKHSLASSLKLSLGQLRKEHSGFKQDVLRAGEDSIKYIYELLTNEIVPIIAALTTSLTGLYFLNKDFFYTGLFFSLIYLGYRAYLNNKVREPMRIQAKKRVYRNKTYLDILGNLFFIKFSNQYKKTDTHLSDVLNDFSQHAIKTWSYFNKRALISDCIFAFYYLAFIFLIYIKISNGLLTAGMIIPIFIWINSLGNSLGQIQNIQRRSLSSFTDLEKMFEMLEQKTDVLIDKNPLSIKKIEKNILFEDVTFDYKEGKRGALKNVSFEIKKGEKVALVGRSGSGKTTIISLLLRLYDPVSGSILIDGVDLRSLVLEDWHDLLAYVQQDGDLLDISIKENILFGTKKKVTQKEIESVLEKAGIKEFIHNLPKGMDTIVGERGVKLSGGQKQRVCIARALIKDAPILLLDEATSSLDSETETVVNKAIWDMLGDKTGVVIAHRLSTILDADKIIVMDHGEIVGVGTHEELVKTTLYYKKLVDAQNINL